MFFERRQSAVISRSRSILTQTYVARALYVVPPQSIEHRDVRELRGGTGTLPDNSHLLLCLELQKFRDFLSRVRNCGNFFFVPVLKSIHYCMQQPAKEGRVQSLLKQV